MILITRFHFTAVLAVLLCLPFAGHTQDDCHCAVYDNLQKEGKPKVEIYNAVVKEQTAICRAKAMELRGVIAIFEKNDNDSAEICLQKATALYHETGCGEAVLWNTYKQLFQVYWNKNDYPRAQEFGLKYLQSAALAKNVYEQAIANTMIAVVFYKTAQYAKGLAQTDNAAALLPAVTNVKDKQNLLYFLAARYMTHYLSTNSNASRKKSLQYNLDHLALSRQLHDTLQFSRSYINLSGTVSEGADADFNKAMAYLDSGYLYMNKSDTIDLYDYHVNKASLLKELKNFPAANRYADSALFFAEQMAFKTAIAECYRIISEIANLQGDYKRAFQYSNMERAIKDSVSNVEKAEAVAELEKKYNQAKNENTIKDLDKKKQLYLLLAIVGLLAAVAIAFFLRQQQLKHKKNILETEQRLNRARMNPHFFFNALTALQKFALKENNGPAMASNLSKFSNIMRETLESTYKEYVTIEQEMEFLNEYLEVQKIRFPQTFSYTVSAAPELEVDELLIPAMIIQPFVENSIEHGFSGVDYPGIISIQFEQDHNQLQIIITDNGKGLLTTVKENNEHISRASQIIKDRIYLLNIKLKTKAGFSIDNDASGRGVVVKIHLPLLYKNQTNG